MKFTLTKKLLLTKYFLRSCGIISLLVSGLTISSAQNPNTWTQILSLPSTNRAAAVAFSIDSFGYVGTGINFSVPSGCLKDFWKYDPVEQTWTQIADFGGGRRGGAAAFVIGGKAYVGTGSGGSGKMNDLWEYDPQVNTWTQKADLPADPRNYATAFTVGNKGYITTGYGDVNSIDDCWQYDPGADTWTQKTSPPVGIRSSAIGFGIGGKGYFGTGYTFQATKDFWAYDTLTDSWTQLADVGVSPRSDACAFVINGHGFVCGGVVTYNSNDLLEYDPLSDSWTTRTMLPGDGKEDPTAFSIGNYGFVGSGYDDLFNTTTDFYQYTFDSTFATSVNEVGSQPQVVVTPNPLTDQAIILVTTTNEMNEVNASLFTIDGKQISISHFQKLPAGKNEVEFRFTKNDLASGLYFLVIRDAKNVMAARKIVIQ